MRKYLVKVNGKTVLATTFAKRAHERAEQTPGAKLITIPAVR